MAYKRSPLMQQRLAGNRQRILLAARQLVAEGGYRNAPVAAVAAAAGMSTGQIYRHFPSKAELFVQVLGAAGQRELGALRESVAFEGSASARLRAAIATFVERSLAGPGLAYAFLAEPVEAAVDAERIEQRRRFGEFFRGLLVDGVNSGEFLAQDLDAGAACVVGAVIEALVGPITSLSAEPHDVPALVEAISGFCLRAVGSK